MQSVLTTRHAIQVAGTTTAALVGFACGTLAPCDCQPEAPQEPVLTHSSLHFPLSPEDAEAVAFFLASPGIPM